MKGINVFVLSLLTGLLALGALEISAYGKGIFPNFTKDVRKISDVEYITNKPGITELRVLSPEDIILRVDDRRYIPQRMSREEIVYYPLINREGTYEMRFSDEEYDPIYLTLDTKPPAIELKWEKGVYEEGERVYFSGKITGGDLSLGVELKDNTEVEKFRVELNGEKLTDNLIQCMGDKLNINITNLREENLLIITAEDKAGNQSSVKRILVLDENGPKISEDMGFLRLLYESGNSIDFNRKIDGFVSGEGKVILRLFDILDLGCGVDRIEVLIQERDRIVRYLPLRKGECFECPIFLPENEASDIRIRAYDRLGQVSESDLIRIYENQGDPNIDITLGKEGIYQDGKLLVFNLKGSLNVDICDKFGIKNVYVSINGNEVYKEEDIYGGGFVREKSYEIKELGRYMDENGRADMIIYAENYGGYSKVISEYTLVRDEKGPDIGIIYDNLMPLKDGGKYGYFTLKESEISVSVNDMFDDGKPAKKEGISVWIDIYDREDRLLDTLKMEGEGEDKVYRAKVRRDLKGYVIIRAEDRLMNKSEKKSGMFINLTSENDHPLKIELEPVGGAGISKENVRVKVRVSGGFCGIRDVGYKISSDKVGNDIEKRIPISQDGDMENFSVSRWEMGIAIEISGSINVSLNSNDISLDFTAWDYLDREYHGNIRLDIDKTPPAISLNFKAEKGHLYYNHDRQGILTVYERNFNIEDVSLNNHRGDAVDLGPFSGIRGSDADATCYRAPVEISKEGEYELEVRVRDGAGNISTALGERFIIDKTKPRVKMEIESLGYTNKKVGLNLYIIEKHFDPKNVSLINTEDGSRIDLGGISWIRQNDQYRGSTVISKSGIYSFSLAVIDKAGNLGIYTINDILTIDLTNPQIFVDKIEPYGSYNGEVSAEIRIIDENLDFDRSKVEIVKLENNNINLKFNKIKETESLIYRMENPPSKREYDGIYELYLSAVDKAGNLSEENLSFCINRFGSVYALGSESREVVGAYISEPKNLNVIEVNKNELNEQLTSVILDKNGERRVLNQDRDFTVSKVNNRFNYSYEYKFVNNLFKEDGIYILWLNSIDRAGNFNENIGMEDGYSMKFGVDATPPLISPLNLRDNEAIRADSFTLNAIIKDNFKLSKVQGFYGDSEISPEIQGEIYRFLLPAADDARDIRIEASDGAGNVVSVLLKNVLISPKAGDFGFKQGISLVVMLVFLSIVLFIYLIGKKNGWFKKNNPGI